MSKRKCGLCGKDPAEGFASINDVFLCHGDNPGPSCYESQSAYLGTADLTVGESASAGSCSDGEQT